MIKKLILFFTTDIWKIRLEQVSRAKGFAIMQLRIVVLALRGFDEDKCGLKSSALTFYTLLSIVPVFAMAFGIAKGFGFESVLQEQLMQRLTGQEEAVGKIITFAQKMLENTRGGLIAGMGIALLLWSVVKLFGNIENSFNDVWGVARSRSIGRKLIDYISAMFICLLLFIMASSLTVAISSEVKLIVEKLDILSVLGPMIFACLKVLPFAVIWVLFTFLYVFMPNTRVRISSGVLAGIVAGTLYQVLQWAYINFQIGVAKYNAIYGGFAALPLFLIWLEISWLIVLLGAEISFARQNVHTYEFEQDCLEISPAFKRLLTLRVVHLLVKRFQAAEPPMIVDDIVRSLDLPVRLARQIMDDLAACALVQPIRQEDEKVVGYQPARSIEGLTLHTVIAALERQGRSSVPVTPSAELDEISRCLEAFSERIAGSEENRCLKDI